MSMTDAEQKKTAFHSMVEASTFKKFLEVFYARGGLSSELVKEIVIEVDETGVWSRAVDPASVGLADATLHPDAFEAPVEGNGVRFGVSIEKLLQYLDSAAADDIVELTLNGETRKLEIRYGGTQVSAACIDPDTIRDSQDIPDLDLPTAFDVPAGELQRSASLADMVSDHVLLTADSDSGEIVASASGDVDDLRHTIDVDSLSADAESLFSVDYLLAAFEPMSADTTVTVELGDEFPVLLHYEEADGNLDVTSMVAPRIQAN